MTSMPLNAASEVSTGLISIFVDKVLDALRISLEGSSKELRSDPEVQRAYLGI